MAVSYQDGYLVYDNGVWEAPVEPPSTAPGAFHGVSCGSAVFCMAEADNYGDPDLWWHGSWSASSSDLSISLGQGPSVDACVPLSTIGKISSAWCVQVDNNNRYALFRGGQWTVKGSRLDPAHSDTMLEGTTSVSCYGTLNALLARSNPRAIGNYVISHSTTDGFACTAANWAGDVLYGNLYKGSFEWYSRGRIDSAVNGMTDVACVTYGFCAAVDGDGNVMYNLVPHGNGWSPPLPADPNGNLTADACGSISFCVAVDFSGRAIMLNPQL
jgi:hypothetical protein